MLLLLSALPAVSPPRSRAEEYYPYAKGHALHAITHKIKAGDVLNFPDGRRFEVKRRLGEGTNDLILAIGDGKALRIPKSALTEHTAQMTLEGYKLLADSGLPVVKVYPELSSSAGHYVVVDEVPVRATLEDAIERIAGFASRFPLEEKKRMADALIEFSRQAARFEGISDFGAKQIGWTGEGWILLDWTESALPAQTPGAGFAMDEIWRSVEAEDLKKGPDGWIIWKAEAAQREERARMRFTRIQCVKGRFKSLLWKLQGL